MKKNKICLTVIKEADGSFSAIGHDGKNKQELIAAQGDTWEELKRIAMETVNAYLNNRGIAPVTAHEIDFGFDLPAFFDAYPQLNPAQLANQKTVSPSPAGKPGAGKRKTADRQVHRIVAAVKQLQQEESKLSA